MCQLCSALSLSYAEDACFAASSVASRIRALTLQHPDSAPWFCELGALPAAAAIHTSLGCERGFGLVAGMEQTSARLLTKVSQSCCAMCSVATQSQKSAEPLAKGIVCGDCWKHVEKYRLRNGYATASIEAERDGKSCIVDEKDLLSSDFNNMVWTTIM